MELIQFSLWTKYLGCGNGFKSMIHLEERREKGIRQFGFLPLGAKFKLPRLPKGPVI